MLSKDLLSLSAMHIFRWALTLDHMRTATARGPLILYVRRHSSLFRQQNLRVYIITFGNPRINKIPASAEII